MNIFRTSLVCASVLASALDSDCANAQQPAVVVHSTISGSTNSNVPGLPGTTFSSISRLKGTANGHWLVTGRAIPTPFQPNYALVDGVFVLVSQTPTPWDPPGEIIGAITGSAVNSTGATAFATVTAVVPQRYAVSRLDASGWTVLARHQELTGIATLPGLRWGSLARVWMDDAGVVTWYGQVYGAGVTSDNNDVLARPGQLLLRQGVTIPAGLAVPRPVWLMYSDNAQVAANGSAWGVTCTLRDASGSALAVIVNGVAVVEGGVPLAGSGYAEGVDSAGVPSFAPDGTWFVNGRNMNSGVHWLARHGIVIAETGDTIPGGGSERWVTFETSPVPNSRGDWAVRGTTDAPAPGDVALVHSVDGVLLRRGDSLDLDQNGVFDDGAFVAEFSSAPVLTDAGTVYQLVDVMNATGAVIGDALLRIQSDPTRLGQNLCASTPNSTGAAAIISATGTTSLAANDLVLQTSPLQPGSFGIFFYGGAATVEPLGAGFRCVAPGTSGIFRLPAIQADPSGTLMHALDLTLPPAPAGQILAGTRWVFQSWFRDAGATGPTFQLSDGLEIRFTP